MFTDLVESKPIATRRTGDTLLAFVAHYGLVLLAIYTSAQAATVDAGPRQEKVEFVVTEDEPKRKELPSAELVAAPPPTREIQGLTLLLAIPNVLPEVDLSKGFTDPNVFTGKRPTPGTASTVPEAAAVPDGVPYDRVEVERPAQALAGSAPAYPSILRQAGVEGEALVSFVVDTSGRAEPGSFTVIRTTHELFAAAVKSALPGMRFIPAEMGARKVRQRVQQPFSFAIVR